MYKNYVTRGNGLMCRIRCVYLQPEHLLKQDTIITAQNLHRAVFIPGSQSDNRSSRRCPTKTYTMTCKDDGVL